MSHHFVNWFVMQLDEKKETRQRWFPLNCNSIPNSSHLKFLEYHSSFSRNDSCNGYILFLKILCKLPLKSIFINQLLNQSFKPWNRSRSGGKSGAHWVCFLKMLCHSKGKILFGMCLPQTIVAFMRKSLQTYSWPYCQCWDRSFSYLLFNNIFLLKNLFFQ